jgi:hypothetical protein
VCDYLNIYSFPNVRYWLQVFFYFSGTQNLTIWPSG